MVSAAALLDAVGAMKVVVSLAAGLVSGGVPSRGDLCLVLPLPA